jgi:hypothetical protein
MSNTCQFARQSIDPMPETQLAGLFHFSETLVHPVATALRGRATSSAPRSSEASRSRCPLKLLRKSANRQPAEPRHGRQSAGRDWMAEREEAMEMSNGRGSRRVSPVGGFASDTRGLVNKVH